MTRRAPRNRPTVQPSDPHPRLPVNAPVPVQHQQVGTGLAEGGRNMLALFGNDNEPRTRCPLQNPHGRRGNAANNRYPPSTQILPARTSLTEMCERYPNHVWGPFLRIFMRERWDEERIWRALPADVRHNNSSTRPWNYLQQAVGRQVDLMYSETHNSKRPIDPRRPPSPVEEPDTPLPGPPAIRQGVPARIPEATPSAQLTQPPRGELETFRFIARHARDENRRILGEIVVRTGGANSEAIEALVERRLRDRGNVLGNRTRLQYFVEAGFDFPSRNPVELLRAIWELRNPIQEGMDVPAYQEESMATAWALYAAHMQQWGREYQEELDVIVAQTEFPEIFGCLNQGGGEPKQGDGEY